ncbi:Mov34/MPN/PAD-1 family protein [Virgibacillus sp. AGTR]|uniref:Mov34/MPN/PAD-1 family protein n=1 Tax=Virgibacillus sp. AGTR TaxID=2812055 RepID=UPI001964E8DA|nr:Mov34/MPN/PAD-1 family protein [Virgibacillus sp. AGTR]MCC2250671.1 Mov34/MPN/PAD-1 family protein [Virgibacillus sp. AGTR]QRZ19538.1 Mov34/MPN/PAD-1 family protein [Virgibacillus sp. AGTR]
MNCKQIIIPLSIHNQMVEHGVSTLPYEACGLLAGNQTNVQSIWQLKNECKSDRRFFVSKHNVERTLNRINEEKQDVLAIYHSHPFTAPIPSTLDMINHPDTDIKMIIISFKRGSPTVRWYRIRDTNYEECLFRIESSR